MPKGYEGVGVTKRTQEGWGAKGTRGAQGAKGTWGGAGGAKGTRGFWGTLCLEGSLLLPEDVGGRAALQQPQVPPEPTALLQLRRLRVPLPHRHHDLRQHRCHPGSCVSPPPHKTSRPLWGSGGGGWGDLGPPDCPQSAVSAPEDPTASPSRMSPKGPYGTTDPRDPRAAPAVPTSSPGSPRRPHAVPKFLETPRCPRGP